MARLISVNEAAQLAFASSNEDLVNDLADAIEELLEGETQGNILMALAASISRLATTSGMPAEIAAVAQRLIEVGVAASLRRG